VKRGEVWWATLDPPAGRRPVFLISRDDAYMHRQLVIVAPVTTRIRGIPSEVALGPADGLARTCVANLDTLTTINKARLHALVAALSPDKLAALDRALRYAVGLR
jgi:mRNA interferase MazF